MSNHLYPASYGGYQPQPGQNVAHRPTPYPSGMGASVGGTATGPFGNVLELGKIGAVVGLCGAGAANLHRLQAGEIDRRTAALDTLRGGAVAGVATAAATLVASRFSPGLLSLAATLATGTAVAYALTAESVPESALATADAAAASATGADASPASD